LEDHGVEVLQHKALEVTRNNDIGRMPAQTAYDLGLATDLPQADAVFLACGNWWTASIVADLEAKVQKPVLTTNNVALWASLQMMGVREKVSGFGRLLSEMPPLTHHEKVNV
jgi:maleate isomerase